MEVTMVRRNRLAAVTAAALVTAFAAAGCGGGDDSGGGGGSGGSDSGQSAAIKNAKVIDVASMDGAKGKVTYCTGKDTTGETKEWSTRFNAKYKAQGLSVKVLEFPASADAQRQQFVQRQEARASDCDVFRSDVIWTAEFASQGWLYDLSPYVDRIKYRLMSAPLQTATYEGKVWGVPSYTNAALLFYRTDKVDSAPSTWTSTGRPPARAASSSRARRTRASPATGSSSRSRRAARSCRRTARRRRSTRPRTSPRRS
jgi:multiple sugar transport system substrate-binding protein